VVAICIGGERKKREERFKNMKKLGIYWHWWPRPWSEVWHSGAELRQIRNWSWDL